MIPQIIHQIWLGPLPRPQRWMDSWRDQHPDWEYHLWDDQAAGKFPLRNRRHFEQITEWAGKADLLRYEILHRVGGFYADADSECIRPLDDELLANDCFGCWESERHCPGMVSIGCLGATPGTRLFDAVIAHLGRQEITSAPAWKQTGPVMFNAVLGEIEDPALTIYPSHFFIPRHYRDLPEDAYAGDGPVYARQYWCSTRVGPGRGKGLYESGAGQ